MEEPDKLTATVKVDLPEDTKKLLNDLNKNVKKIKKVQHFKGGKYQACQVVGKYGQNIELPDEYEVLIIETQKESN